MGTKRVPEIRFKGFSGEWERRKIGDLVTDVRRPLKMVDDDNYQLVTVKRRNGGIVSRGIYKGSEVSVKSQFIIKTGDFLISKRQVVHGANEVVPENLDGSIVSNEYLILNDTKDLNIEFLALISKLPRMYNIYYLSSYGVDIEKLVFDVQDWKKRQILIPLIPEQNQIISFIKDMNKTIALHQQELDILKQTKQGFLQKMFPKEGESVPEVRFPGFTGDWEHRKFQEDIVSIQTGTNLLGSESNSGTPLIKMGNIRRGYFSLDKLEYLDGSETVSESDIINNGDFLFNTRNTLELVGKGATWFYKSNKYAFNNNIARFTFKNINTYFFNYLYNTVGLIRQVRARAVGTTSVAAVYPRDLNSMKYMIPKIEEQTKIGNFFKQLDDTIDLHEQELETLKQTKKAFLQKMFV